MNSPERVLSNDELAAMLQVEQASNPDYKRNRDENEYDFYLDLRLYSLARESLARKGSFKWYDMCCGTFDAGRKFIESYKNLGSIEARGIDVDTPESQDQVFYSGSLVISRGNVVNYPIPPDVDLITCVNGIYLIDKFLGFQAVCKAVEHWYNSLSVGGQMALMREPSLTGYERPDSIEQHLKEQLGQAVEISEPDPMFHPEYHSYIKVVKGTSNIISLPKVPA